MSEFHGWCRMEIGSGVVLSHACPVALKLSGSHSGETPAEDAAQLLAEAGEVLDALETLIRRINRTNATVEMGPDGTLTDALARRDVLRSRHSVVTAAADAAAGKGERGYGRQLRSELMLLSALPVAELRGQADALAREIREVDVRIQRTNWEVDLLD
ncbi:DIP1984 family protein [Streptomyces sp. NPDC048564]|uniref:DIP1984 family protein n=1 Tax=unclassified Streptomyces TaxID=2593676 RepID=UPI0033D5ECD0